MASGAFLIFFIITFARNMFFVFISRAAPAADSSSLICLVEAKCLNRHGGEVIVGAKCPNRFGIG